MSTIVTRAGKGSPLTWNEVDNNFTNLNTDKYQSGSNVSLGTIAGTTITSSALTSGRVTFASTGGLLTDSANLVFTGTNLGVGTATPSSFNASADNLVVGTTSGDNGITIASGSANQGSLFFADGTTGGSQQAAGYLYYLHTNDSMVFGTTNIERMRLDSSGNLALGVSTAAAKFDVAFSDNSRFLLGFGANLDNYYTSGTSGAQIFRTGTTERMRIDSAGNVGIGTSSPDVILTINKNQADGVKIRSANTNGTRLSLGVDTVAGITYIASSREGSGTYMPLAFYTSDLEGMRLDTSGNLSLRGGLALNTNQGPYWNGGVAYISYNNASNFMSFGAASAERMRIDSSGNLGLGVTPSAWASGFRAIDIGSGAFTGGNGSASNGAGVWYNSFYNGTNSIYKYNGNANYFEAGSAGFLWYRASSGTAGGTVTFAESMRLDTSGNLGLGVTPSAWSLLGPALQIGAGGAFVSGFGTNSAVYVGANLHFNGTNWVYKTTGLASFAAQYLGEFAWYTVPSGTAGATATETERMRLTASGNLGLGVTPSAWTAYTALQVKGASLASSTSELELSANAYYNSGWKYYASSVGATQYEQYNGIHKWFTAPSGTAGNAITFTQAMTLDNSGNLYIGRTSDTDAAGITLNGDGFIRGNRDGGTCMVLNRNTNDGDLVSFRQAATQEGTISVSGTTVSYNGGHLARWSQLPDNSKDDTILKGTVLTNLDDMCVWEKDGEVLPNEQLNKMKVSDVEGDTNVAGVFVNWTRDEDCNSDDMNIAMTGDMIIRIADGIVVQKGDLLMSAGDGTAKPQDDDIIRAKTIAKVTSTHITCTYKDGSYCVPCVLMAC